MVTELQLIEKMGIKWDSTSDIYKPIIQLGDKYFTFNWIQCIVSQDHWIVFERN